MQSTLRRRLFLAQTVLLVILLFSTMSDDDEVLSFGPGLSELVAAVETQMTSSNPPLEGSGSGLDLPELLMETSHCCQFAARVSSSNVTGLGGLMGVVLSQEFGMC